ncbi:MAG TPA: DUF192 domain-containing protein [Candidatus Paceibacterota bacterium]|nr:DUF192 domain-containing protein [Candidatus Paceibacterota bacterium]HMO83123.1 DUF192 domain-containing protein [Candidatus Paceibacterota bacterium]
MAQVNKINLWLTYSLLGVFLILALLVVGFYFNYRSTTSLVETVAGTDLAAVLPDNMVTDPSDWRSIYPNSTTMKIGEKEVLVSVALTMSERITGLSGTPFLPEELVKLFVFDSPGLHAIWMKDMHYALDVIWADAEAKIVHIEENVRPESFPEFFTPLEPAKYVIETNAGFVTKNEIKLGEVIVLPNL